MFKEMIQLLRDKEICSSYRLAKSLLPLVIHLILNVGSLLFQITHTNKTAGNEKTRRHAEWQPGPLYLILLLSSSRIFILVALKLDFLGFLSCFKCFVLGFFLFVTGKTWQGARLHWTDTMCDSLHWYELVHAPHFKWLFLWLVRLNVGNTGGL